MLNLDFQFGRGVSITMMGICREQGVTFQRAGLVTTKTLDCSLGTYGTAKKIPGFIVPGIYDKVPIKLTCAKAAGLVRPPRELILPPVRNYLIV